MEHKIQPLFYLLGLTVLLITILVLGESLFLPFVICVLLALLLNPIVSFLEKFYVPRFFAALSLLLTLTLPITWLTFELSEPIQKWAKLLPQYSELFNDQLEEINTSINEQMSAGGKTQDSIQDSRSWFDWFGDEETESDTKSEDVLDTQKVKESIKENTLNFIMSALSATPLALAQIAGGAIFVVFILTFSPKLFVAYIDELEVSKRRKAIVIQQKLEQQLSRYVGRITLINIGLGFLSGLSFYFIGLDDPILWGSLVGFLNFIPYIGMLIGSLFVLLASFIQYDLTLFTLFPLFVYLSLNLIESQVVTPLLLSKQMQVNPLILLIWLALWYWIWGVIGLLIALPMLVCVKLVMHETNGNERWLRFIQAQ